MQLLTLFYAAHIFHNNRNTYLFVVPTNVYCRFNLFNSTVSVSQHKIFVTHLWSVIQRQETKCCHLSLKVDERKKLLGIFCCFSESKTTLSFHEPDQNQYSTNSNPFSNPLVYLLSPQYLNDKKATTFVVKPRGIKKPSKLVLQYLRSLLLQFR